MATDSMRLDRQNARWLGVCAGIANWLDVPAVLVRIVFVVCTLAWPPLIVAYFVIYFCVDKDFTPDQIRDYFSDSETAAHFRRVNYRKPLYRNIDNKRVAGVCAGIADYLEVSAFSVRIVTLLSFFVTGPFTFWAYVIAWFVIEPDPDSVRSSGCSSRRASKQERREARRARRARRAERRERYAEYRKNFGGRGRVSRAAMRNGAVRKGYRNQEEAPAQAEPEFDYEEQASAMHAERSHESADASTDERVRYSRSQCTKIYSELEQRLRGIEAFMTSKRFRLHCEINRI